MNSHATRFATVFLLTAKTTHASTEGGQTKVEPVAGLKSLPKDPFSLMTGFLTNSGRNNLRSTGKWSMKESGIVENKHMATIVPIYTVPSFDHAKLYTYYRSDDSPSEMKPFVTMPFYSKYVFRMYPWGNDKVIFKTPEGEKDWIFNTKLSSWSERNLISETNGFVAFMGSENDLLVGGGFSYPNGGIFPTVTNKVFRYSSADIDHPVELPSMQHIRAAMAYGVVWHQNPNGFREERLVVAGGGRPSTCEFYVAGAKEWQSCSHLGLGLDDEDFFGFKQLSFESSIVWENHLMALGSTDEYDEIYLKVYSGMENKWHTITLPPITLPHQKRSVKLVVNSKNELCLSLNTVDNEMTLHCRSTVTDEGGEWHLSKKDHLEPKYQFLGHLPVETVDLMYNEDLKRNRKFTDRIADARKKVASWWSW